MGSPDRSFHSIQTVASYHRDIRRKLTDEVEKSRQIAEEALRDAYDRFIQRATEYVAKDESTLMRSIGVALRPGDLVEAIRSDISVEQAAEPLVQKLHIRTPYAAFIEYGTDPHPVNREGIEALKKWARRHGMPTDAAWAIATKIREEGMDPHPFIRPALRDARDYFVQRLRSGGPPSGPTGGHTASIFARMAAYGDRLWDIAMGRLPFVGKAVRAARRFRP